MRRFLVALLACSTLVGCERTETAYVADIRAVMPFAPPPMHGKLYLSKAKFRADFGTVVYLWDETSGKGWNLGTDSKIYFPIDRKAFSMWLPTMTNGSPCPTAQFPPGCKKVLEAMREGRKSTEWQATNRKGYTVTFWTDNELQLAVQWDIQGSTMEAHNIRRERVRPSLFDVPPGYQQIENPMPPDFR